MNVEADAEGGLEVDIGYWAESMKADVAVMAKLFETAVSQIIENADHPASNLRMLSSIDRARIQKWNENLPKALSSCIHDLISEQCRSSKDAVAICSWDGKLTYHELWNYSVQVAHGLVELGIKPETKVGVCMDKSRWAIVSMLGILLSGGVVVPLSTQHPLARLEGIIADAGIEVILVDEAQKERLSGLVPHLVIISESWPFSSAEASLEPPATSVKPDNSAWIIFTSGSTGTPKGVVLEHGALSTSLKIQGERYGTGPQTRLMQFAAYTFDVSIADILVTLIYGGCVCIMSEYDRMNRLPEAMRELNVNFANLTPTVVQLLTPGSVPSMRTLLVGGEALTATIVETWANHATILNSYGVSESSVHSAVSGPITSFKDLPWIGLPIAGNFWVTYPNNYHHLVPFGVPGELLLEGPSLAREYLNDPAKTKAAFVTDPRWISDFGLSPGRKFYRTGDLVRQKDDGSLIYIGRRDAQIKIRGQRVEIGEIEHHILQYSATHEAAVVYSKEGVHKGKLVAFLSLQEEEALSSEPSHVNEIVPVDLETREGLSTHLEEMQRILYEKVMPYMVPSMWITLQALPLNPSGKTDRRRLLQWLNTDEAAHINDLTPSQDAVEAMEKSMTHLEREIRDVWSQVLNIPASNVMLNRSFLSLGGDSITAMQVVSRCRGRNISLSVRDVLQCQSITQLTLQTTDNSSRGNTADLTLVTDESFALSPIQELFLRAKAADGLQTKGEDRFNQSVLVRITREIDVKSLSRAVDIVVSKHAMLRARFHGNSTKGWQQAIDDRLIGSYGFQVHHIKDKEQELDILKSAQTSLDLEDGPVFAIHVLLQEDSQKLFLVAHHLVVDLVSWRIILDDIAEMIEYQSLSVPRGVSFQTWCRLLDERAKSSNLTPALVLPYTIPDPDWNYWGLSPGHSLESQHSDHQVWLDERANSVLFGEACHLALRTEPVEVFLAALLHSFGHTFSDRKTPAIFNEGHGRETWDDTIELSATVGWFTTITPISVPSPGQDIIETIRQTKDRRRRIPDKGLPYFTCRFQTEEGRTAFQSHDYPEIIFNYQGRYQQLEGEDKLFVLDHEGYKNLPPAIGANTRATAVFDINSAVIGGKACTTFKFNNGIKHQAEIHAWLKNYTQALYDLTDRLTTMKPVITIGDFPLATSITSEDLKNIENTCLPQLGAQKISMLDIENIYPCSPLQQGILISQAKDSSAYQIRQVYEIRPESSSTSCAQTLLEAWQQVVNRHSILRTAIVEVSSPTSPYCQMVLKSWRAATQRIESSDDEISASIANLERLERKGCRPGHRLTVIHTPTGQIRAVLDVDHALCDAMSVQLIVRDLVQAYDGVLSPIAGPLFSNYIAHLAQQPADAGQNHWVEVLKDAKPCHLEPLIKSSQTGKSTVKMSTAQIDNLSALQVLSREHNITTANVIQLAWALTLATFTTANDVCFGYLVNGRDAPVDRIHELVGPLINMTVCRVDVNGEQTVLEAMSKVRDHFLESLDYQNTALASIQHALKLPERGLFNTGISYMRGSSAFATTKGNTIELEAISADDKMDYDLALGVEATDDRLGFGLQWQTSFTDEDGAQRLLHTLVSIVQSLAQNPNQKLSTVSTLSTEDYQQILAWNASVPPRLQTCLHDILQMQCEKQPDAIAIDAWDGQLNYSELWNLAQNAAGYLSGKISLDPEVKIGLCMEKSKWAIVSMLAIILAGGVVVPLGKDHPLDRLSTIIQDTNMPIILADPIESTRLSVLAPSIITIHQDWFDTLSIDPSKIPAGVTPDQAAWMIYTSGSTGKPKGVVLEHGSLCTSIQAQSQKFCLGPHTRTLQFSAFTFDVSIGDIFMTLTSGGCVCLISEIDRLNNLAGAMAAVSANFVQLTPTVAQLLSPATVPSLEVLVLGGEVSKPEVVKTWIDHATVLIAYGPTECSIACSYCNPFIDGEPSIGLPLAGCFWVTDLADPNRLVPVGVTGELLLEGPLLAREYLNDPMKTAVAFINDPTWLSDPRLREVAASGRRRFYRTGDLVRQNSDGSLTYIGRRDTQVKIRGQRVDLGEIENTIGRLSDDIGNVVADVITRQNPDSSGEQVVLVAAMDFKLDSLHAFESETDADSNLLKPSDALRNAMQQLRDSLGGVLAPYMVPSAYIPMVRLPLNGSGKLDRRGVQEALIHVSDKYIHDILYDETENHLALPTTDLERSLQKLFASALGVEANTIGIYDHFFQKGGDSISAMRMVAAGRDVSFTIKVADIFQNPRIADLSRVIEQSREELTQSPTVTEDVARFSLWDAAETTGMNERLQNIASQCDISETEIEDIYPCTPLQEGLMAISTQQSTSSYMAQRVFQLGSDVDVHRFCAAWKKLTELNPIMRTRILATDSQNCIQVVVNQGIPLVHHTSSLSEYLETDRQTPVAYGGPLTRFALIQEANSDHQFFVWTAHHSTYDGWSLGKMANMLRELYGDRLPPAPTVLFSRFVAHLQSVENTEVEQFWNSQLKDTTAVQFPTIQKVQYRPHVAHKVTRQLPAHHNYQGQETISTVLRAAWALTIAHWTGEDDVIFAVTNSGRNAPIEGILDLVAPTIATVPVRICIDKSKSISDFVSQVQIQATEMISYEHTGLQNIRRLVPEASSSLNLGHLFLVQVPTEIETGGEIDGIPGVEILETSAEGFHSYPLVVECILDVKSENISVEARFDESIISKAKTSRLLAQYERVFDQLLTEKQALVRDIQLICDEDRATIASWDYTPPAPLNRCIHNMVRDRYKSQPDNIAIHAWDGELTYSSLWSQASQLSQLLIHHGVEPEIKVGICMDKSKWAAVSMLAVLQTGGTVVPLGTQHPRARIEGIVSDTKMKLVLVDAAQAERLTGVSQSLVVVSDTLLSTIQSQDLQKDSRSLVQPSNAAWIIFTSGSTGTPKGVVLEHSALCSSLHAHGQRFNIGQETRMMQFAAHSFDVCISEMFSTLIFGGCVCIPSETDRMNNLPGIISSMAVNFAQLTSTVAQLLNPETAPSIKSIVLMGEAVKPAVISSWGHYATVISAYGPSESCIHSSYSQPLRDPNDALSIGQPLSGCFWVTNPANPDQLCPVGVGIIGELLLEGPLLARGYLNDPVKTSNAFITDPKWCGELGLSPGRRLYRTGDLVHQNSDGSLTYVGRRDTQVKIRGQRVEIGEIENWVSSLLPDVRMVAVDLIVKQIDGGEQILLSAAIDFKNSSKFYPTRETASSTGIEMIEQSDELLEAFRQLRTDLFEVLPAYMVPNAYIPLNHLPLNASGKLDRRAVHQFFISQDAENIFQYVSKRQSYDKEPLSPVAAQLRELLADLLNMKADMISSDDNIFQLGSDSITAMRLITLARSHNISLTVADIFKSPTIAGMAEQAKSMDTIEETRYESFSLLKPTPSSLSTYLQENISPLVRTSADNIEDVLPVTDIQAYSVITSLMECKMEQRYFKWVGKEPANVPYLTECCTKLVEQIDSLRTVYAFSEGSLLQVVLKSYKVEIDTYNTDGPINTFAKELMQVDMHRPAKLSTPLFNLAIISHTDSSEHWILFRINHAAYDGGSLPKIWSTLQNIYTQQPTVSYPRFSSFMADNTLRTTQDTYSYWMELLAGSKMTQIGGSRTTQQIPCKLAKVTPSLSVKIHTSDGEGLTPAIYIKTAWAITLAKCTGAEDIIFGDTVSNRDYANPDVADSMGCCINIIPFRVQVKPDWTNIDLLRFVRDQQLASAPNSCLGFRTIFKDCTDWTPGTKFTTSLNHLNSPPKASKLGDHDYQISPAGAELYSQSDIALTSIQWSDSISLDLAYGEGRVQPEVAASVLELLQSVLESLMNFPEASVSKLWQHQQPILAAPVAQNTTGGHTATSLVENKFEGDLVDAAILANNLHIQGSDISIEEILGRE